VNASGVPVNLGTGRITQPVVGNTSNLPLAADITLTFDAASNQFIVTGGPGGTLAYNPAVDYAGVAYSFAGYGGASFTLSGVPQDGDQFVLSHNAGAVSDNRNALAFADLRNQLLLAGGTATYENAYGQLVADVGTKTHQADISRQAQQSLYNKVKDSVDGVSAVNLDEEAADLVRFQQAYQAAAQVIAVTDTLFQTLIGAVRR
jgi:flagellar hook-associated protein 1 FlgK